jgi:hypothetical protein
LLEQVGVVGLGFLKLLEVFKGLLVSHTCAKVPPESLGRVGVATIHPKVQEVTRRRGVEAHP